MRKSQSISDNYQRCVTCNMILIIVRRIIPLLFLSLAGGNPMLKTFYLNKKSDLLSRPISQYNGRECVHTDRKKFFLPEQITLCYRHQPMVFNYRSGLISFGKIESSWSNLEVGIVYANYDSGEWLGFVEGLKPITWIPMGLHQFTTQLWRHSCIAFDFKAATLQLYENGNKMHEEHFNKLRDIYNKLKTEMTIVTLGCAYIESKEEDWTYAMSLLGRYSDFQMFSRLLRKKEMEDITGCKKIVQGDLLSWEQDDWVLNSTRKTSDVEYLRFKGDVCKDLSSSLHLVPFPVKGLHYGAERVCSKLSGYVAE